MSKMLRLGLALAAPWLLASCFLTPGAFESSLHIGRDRSFTFAYVGEVVLSDPGASASASFPIGGGEAGDAEAQVEETAQPAEPTEAQRRAIVEALSRETGYNSVEYVGDGRFRVDYSITGRLDHAFVYPVNVDAMALIPWIAVELRQDGTARMTAMAFGDGPAGETSRSAGSDPNRFRNGTFTLTTDADLVMHNDEDGASEGEPTSVSWRITPTSRSAPTAVVRFAD